MGCGSRRSDQLVQQDAERGIWRRRLRQTAHGTAGSAGGLRAAYTATPPGWRRSSRGTENHFVPVRRLHKAWHRLLVPAMAIARAHVASRRQGSDVEPVDASSAPMPTRQRMSAMPSGRRCGRLSRGAFAGPVYGWETTSRSTPSTLSNRRLLRSHPDPSEHRSMRRCCGVRANGRRGDRLTCTTCHDPHSAPEPAERVAYFRSKCLAVSHRSRRSRRRTIRSSRIVRCVTCRRERLRTSPTSS